MSTIFGLVVGVAQLGTEVTATACVYIGSTSDVALFAAATECGSEALVVNGSSSVFEGTIHSNGDVAVPGSSNAFGEAVSYGGSASVGGGGNSFATLPYRSAPLPPPFAFSLSDYQPGGTMAALASAQGRYFDAGSAGIDTAWLAANAAYDPATGVLQPGLYHTNGDIDLSDSGLSVADGGGVTFVTASGTITVAGSGNQLRPWDPTGLLLFTHWAKNPMVGHLDNCDSGAAQISGSDMDVTGIIYVPRGQLKFNGSSNLALRLALVANTVEFSGSNLTLEGWGSSTAPTEIRLVE